MHPVRGAVDRCPVCGRPRCAADAEQASGGGCPVCRGGVGAAPPPAFVSDVERYIRAALASTAVALLGGVVAAQYVGAAVFAYLTPFVVGVLTGAAAQAAAGGAKTGPAAARIRVLAGLYAVLGVAFGFVLERSEGVLAAASLLPYLAAVAGVVLWTLPAKPLSPTSKG
ncbi:MAG: hypothetical protein ACR2K2_11110 [Mycobacteriales bacterium]